MKKFSKSSVLAEAESNGCKAELDKFLEIATEYGLEIQPKAHSMMVAPPLDKKYSLFSLWPGSDKACPGTLNVEITMWTSNAGESWERFLGITSTQMESMLCPFYELAEYKHGEAYYKVLQKCVDASNVLEATNHLFSLLSTIKQ